MVSNLDLVVSAGCVDCVKRVEINVYCVASPLAGLEWAVETMREAAGVWRCAEELEVSLHPNPGPGRSDDTDAGRHNDSLDKVSAALAAMLPGVRRVQFDGIGRTPIVRELCGRVASVYSGQLTAIDSIHAIDVPPGCVFGQLQSAGICGWAHGRQPLMRIDPASLVKLALRHWTAGHSWALFSTDSGDSGAVEFPSLRELSVQCPGRPAADDAALQPLEEARPRGLLLFPKLGTLDLSCMEASCPLLDCAAFPPRMDRVSAQVSAPVFLRMSEAVLLAAARLELDVYGGSGDVRAMASRARKRAHGTTRVTIHDSPPTTL